MYDIDQAHEDGRHASASSLDRRYWVKAGCTKCSAAFDDKGIPIAC